MRLRSRREGFGKRIVLLMMLLRWRMSRSLHHIRVQFRSSRIHLMKGHEPRSVSMRGQVLQRRQVAVHASPQVHYDDEFGIVFSDKDAKKVMSVVKRALEKTRSGKPIKVYDERHYLTSMQRLQRGTKSRSRLERQEFLGDAILDMIVSIHLYEKNQKHDEGEMTEYRSHLVSRATLAHFARALELDAVIYSAEVDKLSDRMLADAFEALISAVFIDNTVQKRANNSTASSMTRDDQTHGGDDCQGYAAAKDFILGILDEFGALDAESKKKVLNYKGYLSRLCAKCHQNMPVLTETIQIIEYVRNPIFSCQAEAFNFTGKGRASTRIKAEQIACYQVLCQVREAFLNRHFDKKYHDVIHFILGATDLLHPDSQKENEVKKAETPLLRVPQDKDDQKKDGVRTRIVQATSAAETPLLSVPQDKDEQKTDGLRTRIVQATSAAETPLLRVPQDKDDQKKDGVKTRIVQATSAAETPLLSVPQDKDDQKTDGVRTRIVQATSAAETPLLRVPQDKDDQKKDGVKTRIVQATSAAETPLLSVPQDKDDQKTDGVRTRIVQSTSAANANKMNAATLKKKKKSKVEDISYAFKDYRISILRGMINFSSDRHCPDTNFKGCLLEIAQQTGQDQPQFVPIDITDVLLSEGDSAHVKSSSLFAYEVTIFNASGSGCGLRKMRAQHAAAFHVLCQLRYYILNDDETPAFLDRSQLYHIRSSLLRIGLLTQETLDQLDI